jgi:hypothetical protein
LFNPDYLQHAKLDGAIFGPSFAPLFIVINPIKEKELKKYEPLLYGFKVNVESPLLPSK